MARHTDAPPPFVFASIYTFVTMLIGRSIPIFTGRRGFANVFTILVGPPNSRKGTPMANILEQAIPPIFLQERGGMNAAITNSVGSAEGQLECFMTMQPDEDDTSDSPRMSLKPSPGRRVLSIIEEFVDFLHKAHQPATQNLTPIFCQLWDGKTVDPPTKTSKAQAKEPFQSLIGGITEALLEASVEEIDVLGGFFSRCVFFYADKEFFLVAPPEWTAEDAKVMRDVFEAIYSHVEAIRPNPIMSNVLSSPGLSQSPEAAAHWADYATKLDQAISKLETSVEGAMLTRIPIHIQKASLVFALASFHTRIELDDIQRAIALGQYFWSTALRAANIKRGDAVRRFEHRMLEYCQEQAIRHPGSWVTARDLVRKFGQSINAPDVRQSLEALVSLGQLEAEWSNWGGRGIAIRRVRYVN